MIVQYRWHVLSTLPSAEMSDYNVRYLRPLTSALTQTCMCRAEATTGGLVMRSKLLLLAALLVALALPAHADNERTWIEYRLVPDRNPELCVREGDKMYCPLGLKMWTEARRISDPAAVRRIIDLRRAKSVVGQLVPGTQVTQAE